MNARRPPPHKHITVVNDAPDFLLIVRELLEDEGYAVTTSDFEPNVFTRIVMRHPDALILDVGIGQPPAWDLLERLHAEPATTDIPVLVISTIPEVLEHARDQVARYGSPRFLAKPMHLDEVVAAIREMVGDSD